MSATAKDIPSSKHNHRNALTRGIFKAMGMFGGQQVLSIFCGLVRNKLVAIWIGPAGVGLLGIYSLVLDMANNISNLGIRNSSVRDLSMAHVSGKREHIARVVAVVRRWSWALGVLWAFVMLAASPLLSRVTFGNSDHVWEFMALSGCVLVYAITNCEQAVMQGTKRLRHLAQTIVCGLVTGLVISIPMYYFLRIDGIVPSLIVYAVCGCVFSLIFRNRDFDHRHKGLTVRETMKEGSQFVKLGICITISTFVGMLVSYIFMSLLNIMSGADEMGLYKAGDTLVNRYGSLIFASIGLEYYPRLAAVSNSGRRLSIFVSNQVNIILYLLVPVVAIFLAARELVVDILYSSDFRSIVTFVSWCMVGLVLKGASWCIAFVILAKGASRVFLVTETVSAVVCLTLNITFYHLWGLNGIGVSYVVWYALYLVMVTVVYRRLFGLSLHRSVPFHLLYAVAAVALSLWAVEIGLWPVALAVAVATGAWSFSRLRRRLCS